MSPGNDERRALNLAIRQALIDHGQVAGEHRGRRHAILVARDFTPAQVGHFGSYQPGDVIHCVGTRDQQRQGVRKDSWLTVEAVNQRGGLLELCTADGRHIEASPSKWRDGQEAFAEVYTQEERTLAAGDRIQFRHPDKRRDIANGQFATVIGCNGNEATIRLEGKQSRELTLLLTAMRHVDYGYTVTSFSSQGSTVDRVLVNDDSMRSARLVNREQLYVSVSRGRLDARIYTDDAEALRLAVTRDPKKEIALEAVTQPQEIPKLRPRPSTGMSISF